MEYDYERKDVDDLEKQKQSETLAYTVEASDDKVPRGAFAGLWKITNKLDRYGVEARGIERIPPGPEHRNQTKPYPVFFLWLSANFTISTFALGCLGPNVFYLGLKDATLTIIFFNLLCTLPPAYFSVFGAKLGLRQLTLSRFSFGYWTNLIPTALNCIACIGWSVVNSIVGAQALRAVSDTHKIPTAAAIVVIAIATIIVSFLGYKVVHAYEKYSVIPVIIIFLIYLGENAKYMQSSWAEASGSAEAASVLSFGAAIAGFALGWSSLAADYSVRMPEDMSGAKLFWYTYAGLNLPLILVETLGAAAFTTTYSKQSFADAYTAESVGGLIAAGLIEPLGGFGRFCMVVLALSIVANNIPNIYSFALTFQALGPFAQAIPRIFLVLLSSAIYIVLAIVGASHFESWLDTLLVILSYWLAIYCTIILEEHFIFRKGKWSNYTPDEYNEFRRLPMGLASLLALGFGIMGAVLGMAQVWYVGVIGKKIGDPIYGGDIGFELAGTFTAIVYPIARYFELKYWKH